MIRSVLTHLECPGCGQRHDPSMLRGLCECGGPLLVRYDLTAKKPIEARERLKGRRGDMWRYAELMPDPGFEISLGEGWTPLIETENFARRFGLAKVLVKDESLNPTGSFKARGLSAAVGMARKLGAPGVSLPSAGNAGSAAAAYGARAGIPVHVFLPRETPRPFSLEARGLGAVIHEVDGHIGDAGRAMRGIIAEKGWFDLSTCKEPYRVEGKKTMGYEIVEQLDWTTPDAIIYPCGGGTGLIGMWKAFQEMESLGWISTGRRPRLFAVQSDGCAPVVRAMETGAARIEPWEAPETMASGLRVPAPFADRLLLESLRESGGGAVAVEERRIPGAVRDYGSSTGVLPAPEGAACLLALEMLVDSGRITRSDRVVLLNTGTCLKYPEALQEAS
jgi:threonine synthase